MYFIYVGNSMIAFLYFFLIQPVQAEIWPDLSKPPKTKERSNDVALVVSIENYIFASDIQGAQKNGRDWYNYFNITEIEEIEEYLNQEKEKYQDNLHIFPPKDLIFNN